MRAVLQRVSHASVTVAGETTGRIGAGLLVFLGVRASDTESDAAYVLEKTLNLRVFEDESGKMNASLLDTGGALLVVSQFTLYGDVRKGRRPSFSDAARPDHAERLYDQFVEMAAARLPCVQTGRFQAMMDVEIVNAGPVTLLIDSERKF